MFTRVHDRLRLKPCVCVCVRMVIYYCLFIFIVLFLLSPPLYDIIMRPWWRVNLTCARIVPRRRETREPCAPRRGKKSQKIMWKKKITPAVPDVSLLLRRYMYNAHTAFVTVLGSGRRRRWRRRRRLSTDIERRNLVKKKTRLSAEPPKNGRFYKSLSVSRHLYNIDNWQYRYCHIFRMELNSAA